MVVPVIAWDCISAGCVEDYKYRKIPSDQILTPCNNIRKDSDWHLSDYQHDNDPKHTPTWNSISHGLASLEPRP